MLPRMTRLKRESSAPVRQEARYLSNAVVLIADCVRHRQMRRGRRRIAVCFLAKPCSPPDSCRDTQSVPGAFVPCSRRMTLFEERILSSVRQEARYLSNPVHRQRRGRSRASHPTRVAAAPRPRRNLSRANGKIRRVKKHGIDGGPTVAGPSGTTKTTAIASNSFRHGGRVGLDRSDGIDPHRRVTASLAAERDNGLDMRRATGRKIARQESDRSQQ